MNNIYGVYFICCCHNYLEIVKEQLDILNKGLFNITKKLIIFITLYENDNKLINIINNYNKKDNIIIITSKENLYEKFAINNYKNYILEENYYMYYFHTKGLKCKNDPLFNVFSSRRKLLNYFTLEKYIINIDLLKKYDAVGCSLNLYPKKHFSGNFWWSKSSYTKLLQNINNKYLSPEMYILSHNSCNYISLANNTNDVLYENYKFPTNVEINRNITKNLIIVDEHIKLIDLC